MAREARTQLDLLLLATLARGPAHGYRAIELLRERSGGYFRYPEGTVYPALHRLERDGLVASRWSRGDPRRRRVYRLTRKGSSLLARERKEWALLARAVEAVLAA
ncbi:MAG TPA: PadR family transcriptional regulator [Gaiellaceae bacterium]|nr:PadR family transcriptional regulator [Gaiellaceae bacterium]